MSLNDHVPSLELCRKWKEIGGRQDTEFYWEKYYRRVRGEFWEVNRSCETEDGSEKVAAPLLSELMEWGKDVEFSVHAANPRWSIELYANNKFIHNKSLPDAVMQMAIALKEEKV